MSLGVLAFGAAALTAAVAFHQGWSPHLHRRQPATSGEGTAERIGRNLREPSARVAAAAGVWCATPDPVQRARYVGSRGRGGRRGSASRVVEEAVRPVGHVSSDGCGASVTVPEATATSSPVVRFPPGQIAQQRQPPPSGTRSGPIRGPAREPRPGTCRRACGRSTSCASGSCCMRRRASRRSRVWFVFRRGAVTPRAHVR
jgi:hypothetical protein